MNQVKTIAIFLLMVALHSCAGHAVNQAGSGVAAKNDSAVSGIKDISASTSIYTLLCQDWVYKDDAADYDSSNGMLDVPYRGISFFADSTIVKGPHEFIQAGKWAFNDKSKTILIKYENGRKEEYKINAIGGKALTLTHIGNDNEKIILVSDGMQEDDYKNDPLYFDNNRWRIKPNHPETADEIKARVKQYIHFYALYFNDNIRRNASDILFHGLPTCFLWYNGGIGLQLKDKLDNSWINCFYNNEEAMQAFDIINRLIQKNYLWNKDETNWVRQTAPVLQQMCDSLK